MDISIDVGTRNVVWSVRRFKHDGLYANSHGSSGGYGSCIGIQSFVIHVLRIWSVVAVARGIPNKQGVAAAGLDKRATVDRAHRGARGGEMTTNQPLHHDVVSIAVFLVSADGSVEEEPTNVLSTVCVLEQVPAYNLADTIVGRIPAAASKRGRVKIRFRIHPRTRAPASRVGFQIDHLSNHTEACFGNVILQV